MSEGKTKKSASFKDQSEHQEEGKIFEDIANNEADLDEETKMRRNVLRAELAAMASREEYAKARWREKMKEEKKKAITLVQKERAGKGISILPGSAESKNAISKVVKGKRRLFYKHNCFQIALIFGR